MLYKKWIVLRINCDKYRHFSTNWTFNCLFYNFIIFFSCLYSPIMWFVSSWFYSSIYVWCNPYFYILQRFYVSSLVNTHKMEKNVKNCVYLGMQVIQFVLLVLKILQSMGTIIIKLSRNKSIWLEAHNKKWKGTIDEDWNWVPMRRNFNNTKIFGLHSNWRNGVKFYHRSILISDWFRRSYQWFIWEWKKKYSNQFVLFWCLKSQDVPEIL